MSISSGRLEARQAHRGSAEVAMPILRIERNMLGTTRPDPCTCQQPISHFDLFSKREASQGRQVKQSR
ncbi:hypothetical protein, partial [Sinorhizobium meliloti]|uniref:hypothetical protein n=1 Tax=Rhizobium meliloti TaxID=382 RepID=UPI001AED0518